MERSVECGCGWAGVVLDITMEYFNYPSGVFGGMTTSSNLKVRSRFSQQGFLAVKGKISTAFCSTES